MIKLFDASALVCLLKEIDEPGVFDICETLGHDAYTTEEVLTELKDNPITYQAFMKYGKIHVLPKINDQDIKKLRKRHIWMHDGEASIICMGEYLKAHDIPAYCIIDERAREISKQKDILTTGTIGLLLWEASKNKLSANDLQRIKHELKESTFRISDNLLNLLDNDS